MTAVTYILLNKRDYFKMAEEYINLKPLFKTDTFYEKLGLFMKLGGNLILSWMFGSSPMSMALSLYQCLDVWKQYIHYLDLKHHVSTWREIVHSLGGPFISTNDETYQAYVYADGIQRYHNSLFGLTKKGAKCL